MTEDQMAVERDTSIRRANAATLMWEQGPISIKFGAQESCIYFLVGGVLVRERFLPPAHESLAPAIWITKERALSWLDPANPQIKVESLNDGDRIRLTFTVPHGMFEISFEHAMIPKEALDAILTTP
jgi:hypothetical protein